MTDTPPDLETAFAATPPSPQRVPRRKPGRPKGISSEQTRARILDAAERLFADEGYEGAALRDVAAAAQVQLHAVGYHFGPKEALFDTVVARRSVIMTELRLAALEAAKQAAGSGSIPIATLVRDYISPFVLSAGRGDPGWRTYAALMGRLANSPLGTEIIARHYDSTARAYLSEFRRSLPGVPEADVIEGFSAMVAAMLGLCADTGRPARLADEPGEVPGPAESLDTLVRFQTAGFLALQEASDDR
ncbi:TetR/AcrR family transcriptional regulator [Roseobacter sinensis]|uniref:TetR/AcrR family transcriptional regulator n=1 Tax=Roseobacter sinensis TaxID=2931391 RepID=A0ABT3BE64_9RHOB|nr:TetR/AcrR family transcriptional regulator [Roseobacter sp. WL0113]MCV3271863.1 TetR/AcrR family transcriptional regulator [Roseobacter sp. WL0113]